MMTGALHVGTWREKCSSQWEQYCKGPEESRPQRLLDGWIDEWMHGTYSLSFLLVSGC